MAFVTYENRRNPHVTIHAEGCSQIRKRGGEHAHGEKPVSDDGSIQPASLRGSGASLRRVSAKRSPVES